MNSLGLCLGKSAPCDRADLEEGVGRALEGSRSRSQTSVQIAEASKQIQYKCQPACSGWGESRPSNLVYYLGLDAHLVVRGTAVRWGMGMYSTGEERASGDGEEGQRGRGWA